MKHKSLENTFWSYKGLQFDVLKIEICIFLFMMQFLYLLLMYVIMNYFGFMPKLVASLWLIHLLIVGGLLSNIWLHSRKYSSINYWESLKVSKLLQKMLNLKVDSSTYVVSADRQRSVWQNVMRFACFAIVEKNGSTTIYVSNSLSVDSRRSINYLNDMSVNIAKYLRLNNTTFERMVLGVKRFGFVHVEEYEAKTMYI